MSADATLIRPDRTRAVYGSDRERLESLVRDLETLHGAVTPAQLDSGHT
jgi:hypothetical protein